MIGIGVVGLGFMGRAHLVRYPKIQNVALVAVADQEAERRKPDFQPGGNLDLGIRALDWERMHVTASAEDLIRDPQVHIVDICLPTYLHHRYAIMALEQGKHVICEKPLALSVAEADQILAAARAAKRRLFVAQVVRFWPEFTYLQQLVESGELGRLNYLALSRQSAPAAWSWDNWSADVNRSGGVLDVWIHDVDYANFLLGLPTQVFAQSAANRRIILAQFDYATGQRIAVHASRAFSPALGFEARFEAVFEGGMARYLSSQKPTLAIYRGSSKTPEYPTVVGDAYLDELQCFVDCVREDKDGGKLADSISARDSLRLAEAGFASALNGALVKLESRVPRTENAGN
jgi:predicted dehydrogenase